jgi:glycosyltransferase involved in cell wall biosynthesis
VRICIVNNFFPPRVGGSSYVADTLARHYAARGHQVLVITASYHNAPENERRDGIDIVRLPSWTLPESKASFNFDITFALRWGNRKRVFQLLDDFRPDVIHQHGQFFDLTWQSGWWARRRRVPTMLTFHTRLKSPMKLPNMVFRALDAVVVRPILSYLKPARSIAIDTVFYDYIKDRYGIPAERITALPVGVELDRFQDLDRNLEQKKIRERFDLGTGPLIVSLGHVIPLRDRVELVRALPAVLARYPDTKVLVVGRVYYQEFLKQARELGVESAIVCTGALPKTDIPGILSAATMEIHDLHGFGIGIATLEAMAAGRPTVMAERPDYFPNARLTNGENSILIEPGDTAALSDSINRLLADETLADQMGSQGRDWVFANFNMPDICDENLELLEALAHNRMDSSALSRPSRPGAETS